METKNKKSRNGIVGKGLMVLLITCILQIPILLLGSLIKDRKELSSKVKNEVAASWGNETTLSVPELSIPFTITVKDEKGKESVERKSRSIKSRNTSVDAFANVEVLHRAIYNIPVYRSDISISGSFRPSEEQLKDISGDICLSLPINNYKGLQGYPCVTIDGKSYSFGVRGEELKAVIPASHFVADQQIDYTITMKMKGMDKFEFSPKGCDYKVKFKSNHPSPNFKGDFIPSSRSVTDEGFDAEWDVTALNVCNSRYATFGVEFLLTADHYQQSERAKKYSFLFIILVLSAIFLVEMITKAKINIVQYIVTGLSLCLFYLLVLSISEYLPFGWAYLISAVMTTGALSGYFYGFLRSKIAIAFSIATGVLYAFIYLLLQMESGSLLLGSLALFVILGVIMYFTRNEKVFDCECDQPDGPKDCHQQKEQPVSAEMEGNCAPADCHPEA